MLSINQIRESYNPPSVELPNRIRERLLGLNRGKAALVLDAAYFVGMKPGSKFTVNELLEKIGHFRMSPRMVREALKDPIFAGKKSKVKPERGRPAVIYVLPDAEAAALKSGLGFAYHSPSDRLSPDAFKSERNYRLELHYRLIEREPGQYSRALLANRLGVSKRTTRTYDKALNLRVTQRTDTQQIWLETVEYLPVERPPQGVPRYRWLETVKEDVIVRGPLVRGLALKWLSEGRNVWRVQQTTNHYEISESPYLTGKYAALFDH